MQSETGADDIPDPGERDVPRYSRRPLPAYRYVPGAQGPHPHPVRDPRGHSYRQAAGLTRHRPWQIEEWRDLPDWLFGIDLFNRFYFWEAHEAWEGLWASAERNSLAAIVLQGLIQLAAALLKVHGGNVPGAQSLAKQSLSKLSHAATLRREVMGLDLQSLCAELSHYFRELDTGRLPALGADVPILRLA